MDIQCNKRKKDKEDRNLDNPITTYITHHNPPKVPSITKDNQTKLTHHKKVCSSIPMQKPEKEEEKQLTWIRKTEQTLFTSGALR